MAHGEIYTTAHLNFFLFKAAAFFASRVNEAEFVWLNERYSKEDVGALLSPFLTNKLQREITVNFGDEKEVKEFFELAVSLLAHELAEENLDSNVPDRALLETLVVQMLAKQESEARLSLEIKDLQQKFLAMRRQLSLRHHIPEEQVSGLETQERVAEDLGFAKAPYISPYYVASFIRELPAISREIEKITRDAELDSKIIKRLAVSAAEILPPSLNGRVKVFFEMIYQKTEVAVLDYSRENPDKKQIILDQVLEINKVIAGQYSAAAVSSLAPEYLRDEAVAEAEALAASENPASFASPAYSPPLSEPTTRPSEVEIEMETTEKLKEAAAFAAEFFVGALTDEAKSVTEAREISAQKDIVFQEIFETMSRADFRQNPRNLREQELRDLFLALTNTFLGKDEENYAFVQQVAGEIFPQVAVLESQIDWLRSGAVKSADDRMGARLETEKLQAEIYTYLLDRNIPFTTAQAMAYQIEAFLHDKATLEEVAREIDVLKRDIKEIIRSPEIAILEAKDRAYLQTLPERYAELVLVQSLVRDIKENSRIPMPSAEPATLEAELRYLLENLKTDELEKFRDKLVYLKNRHPEFNDKVVELMSTVDKTMERQEQREQEVKSKNEEKKAEEIRIEQAHALIPDHELIINVETLQILASSLTPEQIDNILRTNRLDSQTRIELSRICQSLENFRRDNPSLYRSARTDSRGRIFAEIPPDYTRQLGLSFKSQGAEELRSLINSGRRDELRAFLAKRLKESAVLTGKYPERKEQRVGPPAVSRLSRTFAPFRSLGRIPALRNFWERISSLYARLLSASHWGAAIGALAGGGLASQINIFLVPLGVATGAGVGGAGGGILGRASGQNLPDSVGNMVNRGKNAIDKLRNLARLAKTLKKLLKAAKIAAILANPANWPVIAIAILLVLLLVFWGPIYAAVSAFLNTLPQFRKIPNLIALQKTSNPAEASAPQKIKYSIMFIVPEIEQLNKGKSLKNIKVTDTLTAKGGNIPSDFKPIEQKFEEAVWELNKPWTKEYEFDAGDPMFEDSCIINTVEAMMYIEGVENQTAVKTNYLKIGNPKNCGGDYPSGWPVKGCITRGPYFASHANAEAVDFGRSNGNEVLATHDGTAIVVLNGMNDQGYGNYVKIVSPLGFASLYAHLADGSLQVTGGQKVVKGDILGKVDQSGAGANGPKGGPHLHYQFIELKMDQPYIPFHVDSKDFDPCIEQ